MKKIVWPFILICTLILLMFLFFGELENVLSKIIELNSSDKQKYALLSFLILCSDILLPVPSSIVMFSNGLVLGIWLGAMLSFFSTMSGAAIGYFIGKYTARGLKLKDDIRVTEFMNKYGTTAILISRGIPVLSESISILSGYNRLPIRKFMLYNIWGYIPVCAIYAFFGELGKNYEDRAFLWSFGITILISGIFWYFSHSRAMHKS